MDADVLIVGAGPTGLMLANQLARRGVRICIIDRNAGPSRQTRALGVQARTLELYTSLGIVDRAIALGKPGTGANIWASGRHKARVPLGDAGQDLTPFPYILILGQDDNEKLLGEKLHEFGASVQWNIELVSIDEHPDGVTAAVKESTGAVRTISAKWVAGCDGAHSIVRELKKIEFVGAPYEHVFFVADTDVTGNMIANEVNVYLWKSGFHLFFPMRGTNHWRVVGILPPSLQDRHDVGFEDVVPSIRNEAGASLAFHSCIWFSTYRIHHRRAARFRATRCFLLGDAAHIHSPVGAQGMNTGLQDAYNLAWKLAMVVQGKANSSLLDTYEEERIPVAKQLLNTTDRAFRLVVSDSWIAGLLRTQVLARIAAFAMSQREVQRAAFRVVSQIAIHYRGSSLSCNSSSLPDKAPKAGDRFPWLRIKLIRHGPIEDLFRKLDDTKWNLLLFGQDNSDQLHGVDDLLSYSVPSDAQNEVELARAHIPKMSFYLLRPDGHIGLCGTEFKKELLENYFKEREIAR